MTLINKLIKEAKEGATVLEVPENHLRTVAEHMRQTTVFFPANPTIKTCEEMIRKGDVFMAGVPLKVVSERSV